MKNNDAFLHHFFRWRITLLITPSFPSSSSLDRWRGRQWPSGEYHGLAHVKLPSGGSTARHRLPCGQRRGERSCRSRHLQLECGGESWEWKNCGERKKNATFVEFPAKRTCFNAGLGRAAKRGRSLVFDSRLCLCLGSKPSSDMGEKNCMTKSCLGNEKLHPLCHFD